MGSMTGMGRARRELGSLVAKTSSFEKMSNREREARLKEVAELARGIFGGEISFCGNHSFSVQKRGEGTEEIARVMLESGPTLVLKNPNFADRALQFGRAYEQAYMPYSEGNFEILESVYLKSQLL